jgi:hypothetical protein
MRVHFRPLASVAEMGSHDGVVSGSQNEGKATLKMTLKTALLLLPKSYFLNLSRRPPTVAVVYPLIRFYSTSTFRCHSSSPSRANGSKTDRRRIQPKGSVERLNTEGLAIHHQPGPKKRKKSHSVQTLHARKYYISRNTCTSYYWRYLSCYDRKVVTYFMLALETHRRGCCC